MRHAETDRQGVGDQGCQARVQIDAGKFLDRSDEPNKKNNLILALS